ncbi:tripartite tricarboxylate transporter TctB family protein [Agrobacterium rosae]|uniref:tripartite tricarboxylate transporter TctB family protein n=1 Tax=Agrobacterium rosae TaxID=1972867 RepID=UPI0020331FEA|nr:tripartite tricarboxylate transporter TctB family protein [Agrobacterium rosae]MCM2435936.1 tripartite tricarboxylate transporter TctB family protein [Agrobacterium rosae]
MSVSVHKSRRDVFAGAIFIAIAAIFLIQGMKYDFGTAIQMGPGFFPIVLAAILAIFGVLTVIGGIRKEPEETDGTIAWRAIFLVCLALAIFGAGARSLGLLPVVFICTFMTAFASRKNSLLSSAIMAVVMAVLCYVIFKIGLAISLPAFGPVFGS